MKKILKRILYAILAAIVVVIVVYAWPRVPIITAFAAKGMCSSVFLAGKDPGRVAAEDLSFFPISLAKTRVNYDEKSVTATVFGLARRKAVFREGFGAVIVLDTPEEKLREASIEIPDPGYNQDTVPWPKGDVLSGVRPDGVDYEKLDAIIGGAFDLPGSESFIKTLGVAVVYDGELIAEKYIEGYNAHTICHSWSMTKSLTGVMTGILVGQGRMDPKAPVDIPSWKNGERATITLANLIQMNSGLEWEENYFTISEVTLMLMQSEDMFEYAVGRPAEVPAGTEWKYSSGNAMLISGLIRRAAGSDEAYHRLPYTGLMHRTGMLHTTIETDAAGNFVASSFCYGTPRDWARFGLLCLNNGVFAGDTVLPPGWIDFLRSPAPNSGGVYGGTFRQKQINPDYRFTDAPDDLYLAYGFQGQMVLIVPSKDLVVVRMGYSLKNFDPNAFLMEIISTLPG
jgi:CubicO group peptidase (beta-lactamase class C family)